MAETSPIRYSFGGDEHLFAEVSNSMSLEAFFKGMAVTRAVERLALEGVLDVCLANASFQIRFDPDRIAPQALLDAVQSAEAQAVAERTLRTRIIEIPVLYNDPWTHETLMRFVTATKTPAAQTWNTRHASMAWPTWTRSSPPTVARRGLCRWSALSRACRSCSRWSNASGNCRCPNTCAHAPTRRN